MAQDFKSFFAEASGGESERCKISVTSTSDEPNYLVEKATPPTRRIEAAERLSKAGFDVSIRVSPYIPELVDLEALNRTTSGSLPTSTRTPMTAAT